MKDASGMTKVPALQGRESRRKKIEKKKVLFLIP
jgi:hypothetical protein